MPSYIELNKNGLIPSSSGAGTLVFGLDVYGNITLVDNNGYQTYNSTNLGNSVVGGQTINIGTSNNTRSALGISFGSFNYMGGPLYTSSLDSGSTILSASGDLTNEIEAGDFLYVTDQTGFSTQTIEVNSINYSASTTYITLSSSIDNTSVSASFSQTNFGINTLALGTFNTLQGNNSLAIGGNNQILQYSNNSVVIGSGNATNKSNTLVSGVSGVSRFTANRVISGKPITKPGDCQTVEVMVGCITTDNTPTAMTLYGDQKLILDITNASGSAYNYRVDIVAMQTDDGDFGKCYSITYLGLIAVDNINGIREGSNTTPLNYNCDPSLSSISSDIGVDTNDNSLIITVTGQNSKTIKWSALVTLIQTFQ